MGLWERWQGVPGEGSHRLRGEALVMAMGRTCMNGVGWELAGDLGLFSAASGRKAGGPGGEAAEEPVPLQGNGATALRGWAASREDLPPELRAVGSVRRCIAPLSGRQGVPDTGNEAPWAESGAVPVGAIGSSRWLAAAAGAGGVGRWAIQPRGGWLFGAGKEGGLQKARPPAALGQHDDSVGVRQ